MILKFVDLFYIYWFHFYIVGVVYELSFHGKVLDLNFLEKEEKKIEKNKIYFSHIKFLRMIISLMYGKFIFLFKLYYMKMA